MSKQSVFSGVLAMGMMAQPSLSDAQPLQEATFAGGCFWCVEHLFDEVEGVVETLSGYTGGAQPNPTYPEVSAGKTGHVEAVKVRFDPTRVRYETLLEIFWHNIDPTTPDRQFCDWGSQYRSVIFYHGEAQRETAQTSLATLERSKPFREPIVTELLPAAPFYPAEEYHQDYHHRNPLRYGFYRSNCGRDQRLRELWGEKPASANY